MNHSGGGSIYVLHVDDEPSFGELTAAYLERKDDRFEVETVTSADEAIATLADRPPDCIVSDYNMPGKDGLEFLEVVRETHPDLPFILFTGRGSEQVASDAIAADVTDYLQKGSGSEQYELLANRIRNAVQARRTAETAARQEQLIRLTEFAGDTGGWELDLETEEIVMTEGARRLVGLPEDLELSMSDAVAMYHPDDREDIRRAVDRVAETGETVENTYRLNTRDGETLIVDLTITPVTANGEISALRGAVHDITDRRERRRELERTETLVEHAQDAMFLISVGEEFTVEQVNPAYESATGVSADRIQGESPQAVFGEAGAAMAAKYRECVTQRTPLQYDEQVDLDGETTHWETRIAPVVIEDTVEYIAGSTRDITEQRQRQRELEAERRFVEQALDTLDDLFYVLNPDGTLRRWNQRVPAVTGHTDAELAGMSALDLFPPDEHGTITNTIEATLSEGSTTVEADVRSADGGRIPHEFRGRRLTDADGETTGIVGIGRDLTERRRQERRFRALVEGSNDVVSVVDADGVYQYQSPSLERVLGHDPKKTVGDRVWEYIHPDDREAVRNTFERWVTGTETTVTTRYRARHADGSWRWMEARGSDHLDDPSIEGYVINSRDITEQKQDRAELERTRELMSNVERLADVGAWEYDPQSDRVRLTEGAYRVYEIDPERDISLSEAFDLFYPEDRARLTDRFDECLETGRPYTLDVRLTTGEGRERWITARGERVQKDDGVVARGYVRDITEQKRHERRLTELNWATRRLLTAESEAEVADIGVEAASDVLDVQVSAIELADGEHTELVPAAQTGAFESAVGDVQPLPMADSIAGQVYHEGESAVVDNVEQNPDAHDREAGLEGHRYLPLADHGVLLAGSDERPFDGQNHALLELLAGSVAAALDRIEHATQVREQRERLSLFFEESPLGAVQWDDEFRFQRLNRRAEELLGYDEAELRGESWETIVAEDDRQMVSDVVERLLAANGGRHALNRNVTADGEQRICEWHNRAVTDADGAVKSIFSKFQDVTDQERRRAELEEFETIIESLTDAVYVVDEAGRFTYVNREFVELVGYDRETILGSGPSLVKDDEAVERAEQQLGRLLSSNGPDTLRFEVTIRPREGDPIVCQDHMGVLPYEGEHFDGSVGVLRDISDQKAREQRLSTIKNQYQTLVEQFPEGAVFLYDRDLRVVRAGGTGLGEVGLSPEAVEGSTPHDRYPAEISEELVRYLERALDGESSSFEQAYGGEQYRVRTVPVQSNGGESTHVMAVSTNISEQREHRRELNRKRQRYTTLFETLPNPVLHARAENGEPIIQTVNQEFVDTFGCDEETVVGEPLREHVLAGGDGADQFDQSILNGESVRTERARETVDGIRTFQLSIKPRDIDDGHSEVYAVYTDITERIEYEQELERQNERLDEFASIVSHDLRNPLTVAKGRLELARESHESDHLARAADAVDRSQSLIEDLLTLARQKQETNRVEPVDLAELARQSWQTVDTGAATLTVETTQTVQADTSQLQQLLENLYRNSVEHSSTDSQTAAKHRGDGVTVRIGEQQGGFYVADTGPGIPEAQRERVFEAGYSTADGGTGFGLRIVEQVVDTHGWEVAVTESRQGGARFEITGVTAAEN